MVLPARRFPLGLRHVENLYLYTRHDIELHGKPKKHFRGTNQGSTYENVMLPLPSSTWMLPLKTKKQIYGVRRFRPGGKQEDGDDEDCDDGDEAEEAARTDETVEPVFFNVLPLKVIEETIHSFNLQV